MLIYSIILYMIFFLKILVGLLLNYPGFYDQIAYKIQRILFMTFLLDMFS